MNYIDLHIHTEYTEGNGISRISDLVDKAKSFGMKKLAITDSGNINGFEEFNRECTRVGIKPIFGCGFYYAPLGLELKETEHLVLLAKNSEGLKNIRSLVDFSLGAGKSNKPRIDLKRVKEHSSGIICLTGGLGGVFDKPFIAGNQNLANDNLLQLKEVFGDNLYLELQDNETELNSLIVYEILKASDKFGIKTVVTGGSFYINRVDAETCNLLRKRNGNNPLEGSGYYFKSPDEVFSRFESFSHAVNNSGIIADYIEDFNLSS